MSGTTGSPEISIIDIYPNCRYCGYSHDGVCPRVREIEYHQNGTVKRVSFFKGMDVADYVHIWPSTVPKLPVAGSA